MRPTPARHRRSLRPLCGALACAAFAGLALVHTAPAQAQARVLAGEDAGPLAPPPTPTALEEITKLMAAGKLDDALKRADERLAQQPRDAQVRFVRGVILSEKKQTAAALQVFQQLTEDFPELPEPFNNMAVIYAGQGQLEQARSALERALQADPKYATAHENLGDLHVRLAAASYQRAAALEPNNRPLALKLAQVRELAGKLRASR